MILFLPAGVLLLSGQLVNRRMKKRVSSLEELIIFIEGINSQISFSKRSITDIITELSCFGGIKLKTICDLSDSENPDFSEKWKNSVEKFSSDDCLKKEDEKILLSFGRSLGVTDLQGQSNNCRLHISMLEKQLEKARKELEEKSKTNSALSLFMALAVIIIFY